MIQRLVSHERGHYAVVVRRGGLASLAAMIAERHPGHDIVVISDAQVAEARPSPLPDAPRLTFPAGERSKTRDSWARLTDELLAMRLRRATVIVAFGGGVTNDLAGFVAATYLRGVPWVAVPTSTLAMLDAAVGGKTGVDTPAGKNLVGAIHAPSLVMADPEVLDTLPERNFREGLAEAVKHAAIADATHGDWILAHSAAILARDPATLEQLVGASVAIKADVVADDEHEHGRRAVLNAGHTVAHAIEHTSGYAIAHGEAVAIGLVLETRTAEAMGVCERGTATHLARLLEGLGLPVTLPASISMTALLTAMGHDKKNQGDVIHAALITRFGSVTPRDDRWTVPLDLDLLRAQL